jgi:hypothetical protein
MTRRTMLPPPPFTTPGPIRQAPHGPPGPPAPLAATDPEIWIPTVVEQLAPSHPLRALWNSAPLAGAWAVFLSAFACGCAIAQGPYDGVAAVSSASATDGGGPLCCTTQNLCQELAWCNSPSWAACLAGTSPTFDAGAHYAADLGGPELCCYQPGLNAPTDAGPMSSANTNCFDGGETPAADTGATYFCEGPSWLVNSPPCVEGAACSLDMVDGGSTPGTCAVVR